MKSRVNFKLILITDSSLKSNLSKIVKEACRAGVKAVQLREKNISAKRLLVLSRKLRTITNYNNSMLLINDRLDIAVLCNADGLHSPENGITPGQLNSESKLLFGRSVHSLASAKEAEKLGFDYLIFGPIFPTPSKLKYGSPQGLSKLRKVCRSVKIPVFAVGGINPKRAKQCIEAEARGVAVIREIMLSKNVQKTVEDFRNTLNEL